jgi:hypothetical protein
MEVLGEPRARVMEYLIVNSEKSERFVGPAEIQKDLQFWRPKVYQYLKDLKDQKLIMSSAERPAKYRSIEKAALLKRLGEIAEEQIVNKKRELDEELKAFREELLRVNTLTEPLVRSETGPSLQVIRRDQVDTFLAESLATLEANGDILCETPSLPLLLRGDYQTFRLNSLLDKESNIEVKCISGINLRTMKWQARAQKDDDLVKDLETVKQTIKESEKLTVVFTDKVRTGSPTTIVFGNLRAVMILPELDKKQPHAGFMLNGWDAVRTYRERFKAFFNEIMKEAIASYLDDLKRKQKAGQEEYSLVLDGLMSSLDEDCKKVGDWRELREILIRNVNEEQRRNCLVQQSLMQLNQWEKALSSS